MGMGGSERLVYNLISKLDRTRFNPSLACFVGDEILPDFKNLGVPLYHIPKKKRFDFKIFILSMPTTLCRGFTHFTAAKG